MYKDMPHVSIIILNWNIWEDTVECLESVYKSDYNNFNIILIDNKSTNESIQNIYKWAMGTLEHKIESYMPHLVFPEIKKPINTYSTKYSFKNRCLLNDNIFKKDISPHEMIFILNDENAGFAAGTNIGINIAMDIKHSKYIFALNNDTVIEKDTISMLVNYMEKFNIHIANPIIYNYYDPKKIEFAGGVLFPWAKAKYYKSLPSNLIRTSTFLNGCAMMINKMIFKKYGLLTEKFFHGEEDFEFSWRMRQVNEKNICICQSKVFHKEGSSVNKVINYKKQKIILSYLNRVVNMKFYFNPIIWSLWKFFVSWYYIYLLIHLGKCKFSNSFNIMMTIYKYTSSLNEVDKDMIDFIIREYS